MYRPKPDNPREQHRVRQARRVNESPTLAEKFQRLKSLTAALNFSDTKRPNVSSDIKYFLDPDSKSVFRVGCRNHECIGGDFELTDEIAAAIGKNLKQASGEKRCAGWRDKNSIHKHHCTSVLKYQLTFTYGKAAAPVPVNLAT
jgi:pantothenate kinase